MRKQLTENFYFPLHLRFSSCVPPVYLLLLALYRNGQMYLTKLYRNMRNGASSEADQKQGTPQVSWPMAMTNTVFSFTLGTHLTNSPTRNQRDRTKVSESQTSRRLLTDPDNIAI